MQIKLPASEAVSLSTQRIFRVRSRAAQQGHSPRHAELCGFRIRDRTKTTGDLETAPMGFLDGSRHDVGRERQISGFELEALCLGQRLLRFDRPTIGTEQVERVADGEAKREQAVDISAARRRRRLWHDNHE